MMKFHPLFLVGSFDRKVTVPLGILFFIGQFYFGQVTLSFTVNGFDYDFGMKLYGFTCFGLLLLGFFVVRGQLSLLLLIAGINRIFGGREVAIFETDQT